MFPKGKIIPALQISIVLYINLNIFLFAGIFSIKGQFWASGKSIENQSNFITEIDYIPTFSAYYEYQNSRMVDLEWAYRLDRSYTGSSLNIKNEKSHRYWVRYSSNQLEVRLGLQKIVFGPSQILRPLSWFDTIDLKDPTGLTDGVEAFRLRWFPSNYLSAWSWVIMNDQDTLSYGGRGELSTNHGELGLTVHIDPSNSLNTYSQAFGPHKRLALDYRYDGFIGFWNESAMIISDGSELSLSTIGADYTLPVADGIPIMTETMYMSSVVNGSSSSHFITAFMAGYSIGMFHNFMFISNFDWDENNTYNYLRWSSSYDHFSINCMASINPGDIDNSLQLMLIYNH